METFQFIILDFSVLGSWLLTGIMGVLSGVTIAYLWSDQRRIERALDRQGIPCQYACSLPFVGHIQQFGDHSRLLLENFTRPNQPALSYFMLPPLASPLVDCGRCQTFYESLATLPTMGQGRAHVFAHGRFVWNKENDFADLRSECCKSNATSSANTFTSNTSPNWLPTFTNK